MADKAKKGKNKNLITSICAGIVVIAVVVAVVVVALMGGNGGINDDYFVSDDTKAVITFDGDQASMIFGEGAPNKVHIVYTFDGDKVTSYKSYYEYSDNNAASEAKNKLSEEVSGLEDTYSEIVVNGKYLVLSAPESEYAEMTAESAKQQIELLEAFKNMSYEMEDAEIVDNGETVTVETVEETATEE